MKSRLLFVFSNALPSVYLLIAAGFVGYCWDASAALLFGYVTAVVILAKEHLRVTSFAFESTVTDHEGSCLPVWVNKNQVDYMLTGACTGFFKRALKISGLPIIVLVGPEFHGYIRDNQVHSTYGITGRVPG